MNKEDTIGWVKVILSPSYWIMNDSYSKVWDNELTRLMSEHKFTKLSTHTAYLGDVCIWVGNHPYASFTPYGANIRPSRLTIMRAYEKLIEDVYCSNQKSSKKCIIVEEYCEKVNKNTSNNQNDIIERRIS